MNPTEIIGNCHLYLGDCREILPSLPKVDLVLTDPPYGLAEKLQGGTWGNQFEQTYKDWDGVAPDISHVLEFGKEQIVWGGNYFQLPPSRCFLVHDKAIRGMTFADCEMAWTSMDANARVFTYQVPRGFLGEERLHPTQKPVPVMEWCISIAKNTSTVADPFMGSGTTGVACANMGKTFYGIEREQKYFDIAARRIEAAYAELRLFA